MGVDTQGFTDDLGLKFCNSKQQLTFMGLLLGSRPWVSRVLFHSHDSHIKARHVDTQKDEVGASGFEVSSGYAVCPGIA